MNELTFKMFDDFVNEIYDEIIAARDSNYKAIKQREDDGIREDDESFISMCYGKIYALDGVANFLDELYYKYLERMGIKNG